MRAPLDYLRTEVWKKKNGRKKTLQLLLNPEAEVGRYCSHPRRVTFHLLYSQPPPFPDGFLKMMCSCPWDDFSVRLQTEAHQVAFFSTATVLYGMIAVICDWLQRLLKKHINLWGTKDKCKREPRGWSVWIWIALLGPFPRLQGKQVRMHGSIHNKLMRLDLHCAIKIWLH